MSIALSPLILMSEMAPPAGVARAHIVSLFIIYIICVYVPLIYIHVDGGVAIFYQRHTVVSCYSRRTTA